MLEVNVDEGNGLKISQSTVNYHWVPRLGFITNKNNVNSGLHWV